MARVSVPVTTHGFVRAALTTAISGADNDLTFTAVDAGPGGNDITIEYLVAGTDTPLTVDVAGKAITVNVATDGAGDPTSSASDVMAKLQANVDAARLVTVELAASNDGTGTVDTLSATPLAGGSLGVAQPSETNADATNGMVVTGNDGTVTIRVRNTNGSAQTVEVELSPQVARGQSVDGAPAEHEIAAGATEELGTFPAAMFNQNADGDLHLNPSHNDLRFRAYKTPQAR